MPGVAGSIISNLVNRAKGLDEIHDDMVTIDSIIDVPAKDSTADVQMSDVIGKKDDTAQTTVGTTRSLVAYLKGVLNSLVTIDGLLDVPSKDATADAYMREVVGKKDDTAQTTVATTRSLMAYLKGVLNALSTVDGYHDVPTADVTTNTQARDVVGNKTDTAVTTVGTEKTLMAYLKGVLNALSTVDGYHDVPTADVTTNAQARDVVGNKTDAAVTTVGTEKTLMAYLKGLVNELALKPTTSYFAQTIPIKMNSLHTINNTQATKVFVNAVVPAGLISTTNAEAKKVMLLITGTYVNTYAGTNALDCTTAAHNQWQYKAGGAGAYADLTNAGADGQMLDNDWRTPKEGGAGSFSMMFDVSTVADDDIDAAISVQLENGRSEQASMEITVNAFLMVLWQK